MTRGGRVLFLLHAHLPFVRHLDEGRLEHEWLFEALRESYIPLLMVLERVRLKGPLTLSVSPTLIAMLQDDLLRRRFEAHLDRMAAWQAAEMRRIGEGSPVWPALSAQGKRLRRVTAWYRERKGDVLGEMARIGRAGVIDLWTTAATHAFLPYAPPRVVRAELEIARAMFEEAFGVPPRGWWLPECGWRPGLDAALREVGAFYTVLELAEPDPLQPLRTSRDLIAFGRDRVLTRMIWDAHGGYPASPAYRDFYRDIGFELSDAEVAPYLAPYGVRRMTGFKYWRVTPEGATPEPYDPDRGAGEAERHADDFARRVRERLRREGADGWVALPFDAELFGHWWHEGPDFLARLLPELPLAGAGELDAPESLPVRDPEPSSWGRGGTGEVWCNPKNDWIYPIYARADEALAETARAQPESAGSEARALGQAARELLLALASDFAFMLDAGDTAVYANERLFTHLDRFSRLLAMVRGREPWDADWLSRVESEDGFARGVDAVRAWRAGPAPARPARSPGILMLAWEYPPTIVGGLGQHVYDLSRSLAARGAAVTVVTLFRGGPSRPGVDGQEGVEVIRVPLVDPAGEGFWDFALALGRALFAGGVEAFAGRRFGVVHCHDWMTLDAGLALRERFGTPLVATIHATERGRQGGGLTAPIQHWIDDAERDLGALADRIIVCSRAMRREVEHELAIPRRRIVVVPNGVDPERVEPPERRPRPRGFRADRAWVLFVGRLVPEKGVDVLLRAWPGVTREHPAAELAILGSGPYQTDLEAEAEAIGVADRVHFFGFTGQAERNRWLRAAKVAVFPSRYEPFGIAALEAMVAGVPVVASATGGMADYLLPGENALAVRPGDVEALSRAISALLANPALGARLSERARFDASRFSWSRIAGRTERVYRRLGITTDG